MSEVVLNKWDDSLGSASWYYPFVGYASASATSEIEADKCVDWQLWLDYGAWRSGNDFIFPDEKSATAFLLRWS